MHLKHDYVSFGHTKQLSLILPPIWLVSETDLRKLYSDIVFL